MTQQNSRFMCWTSRLVIVSMLALGAPLQSAHAGMIETGQTLSHTQSEQRVRLNALFEREDVLAQLQSHGVSAADAKARVNALTDDEVQRIAGKLDQLPAGGDVIGVLLTIFIVLLITDILGFTKVFPFTRSIK